MRLAAAPMSGGARRYDDETPPVADRSVSRGPPRARSRRRWRSGRVGARRPRLRRRSPASWSRSGCSWSSPSRSGATRAGVWAPRRRGRCSPTSCASTCVASTARPTRSTSTSWRRLGVESVDRSQDVDSNRRRAEIDHLVDRLAARRSHDVLRHAKVRERARDSLRVVASAGDERVANVSGGERRQQIAEVGVEVHRHLAARDTLRRATRPSELSPPVPSRARTPGRAPRPRRRSTRLRPTRSVAAERLALRSPSPRRT